MDQIHNATSSALSTLAVAPASAESPGPQDDDERFIVGLVLTYYRRHPQRARTRLLDLLGEVLVPTASNAAPESKPTVDTHDNADALWASTQAGVAPLKRKR